MLTTALVVFMEGINPSIRLILEARNISSYEEAVRIATEKENVCGKNDNQKNHRPFNNNQRTSNKAHIKCNKCSKMGHYANEYGKHLSATDVVTHKINTPRCAKPINIRPCRLPWAYQQEIEKQLTDMKQNNIIRNSTSPFNFPLIVVKKKGADPDGKQKLRICVDFRKLNEITENEAYSLPNLLEILESLGSSKYFSTLDLKSGYHQIKIDESDIHKTAFSTKSGHYEYIRMPFGLSSAPATFTRAMKAVLMGLEEMCTAYLDDIVVHGSSLRDHQEKLIQVFDRLRVHNLKLHPKKCNFLRKEVAYLGHIISETGVPPDPSKIQSIKNYPRPLNAKDVKSFLGLSNYYRRFVDNFTKFAQTLYRLCDLNCIKSFDLEIGKLLGNDIKLEKEQLKVIKVKQEYEGREYYHLQLQISELKNITVEQQINNFVFRHFGYMNLLLTKYMAETDILLSIIEAAKLGQIHPYLLGPTDLLAQFQDIRLSLPIGTDFPYPLSLETVNDIVKLSDVKIYYSNNNIVFILTIPLIYQNNFILYHLIPKPYCHTNINCIYIAPSHKFLAISKNKEHYVAYDEFHYNQCKHARSFLLCPEIQSLHPRNLRPICEVQLLQDPKEVPTTCDIRHVRMQATIFHKLSYRNKWLYATDSEVIIINCENDQEASTHLLEGVGIISINETCKGYATRDLLLPSTNSENNYSDFIPTSIITQQEFQHVSLDLYTMKDENVINNHMSDLNLISKTHMQLQEHNNNIYKVTQLQNNQIIHNYILYLTIFLTFVISIAFLQIKSNEQRSLIVEQNKMVQIRQSTGTIHYEEPATSEATAPTITEEAQAAHAYTIYPTLKTCY
ncbi:hypothetical protein QTP88_017607 [Uroleucon formosanum]